MLMMLVSTRLMAQDRTITGKLTSAAGNELLPGVNVIIQEIPALP
jgi:hypothetical protein